MKKLLFVAPFCAAMAVASVASHADTDASAGRFFVAAAVGNSHSNISDLTQKNDLGYGVSAGYRWADRWGIEAGYVDLGQGSEKYSFRSANHKLTLSTSGWTLGANGKWDFAQNWYADARVGALFADTEAGASGFGEASSSDIGGYAGVGIGYDVTKKLGIGVNFDRYWTQADNIVDGTNAPYLFSVKAEYRF